MMNGFLITIGVILAIVMVVVAAAYGVFKFVCWIGGAIGGTIANGYNRVRNKEKGGI